MKKLDKEFWDEKYKSGQMGWDIGYPSPPITEYFQSVRDKSSKILIPGAGNAYEADYLVQAGFGDITIMDISSIAIRKLKSKFERNNNINLIEGDFFDHKGQYDIIIEQTFFCALDPSLRTSYVNHMHSLLNPNGVIIGVLFDVKFEREGPPFGGSKEEYYPMFDSHFTVEKMEPCYNSIPPRMGNELFIKLRKSPI